MSQPPSTKSQLPPLSDDLALRERVKGEMRKRMRGLRATMPVSACAARSIRIVERLNSHALLEKATSVALFWPIVEKREVDLRPLHQSFRQRGVRVAYPRVRPDTGEMQFHFVDDEGAMAPGSFGIMEPHESAPLAKQDELSAILVPALVVDERGHRIGYGRGFYDRVLAGHGAKAIAVAYHYQLVSEIPNAPYDVPVGWIVTDETSLEATPSP